MSRDAGAAVPVLVESLRSPVLRTGELEPPAPFTFPTARAFTTATPFSRGGTAVPPPLPPAPASFRREVVEALGRLKGQAREAAPALRSVAREADPALREAAAAALQAIDPEGATGAEAP